ncbi:uncharacterized protein LOC113797649 [Dermatophagoides pteronyssinus]|uniref:uncharacterized protein LOC113797649 n=1 Tax=Dermatophagoides pteronyssinus TaxID=6956 RepID=UPI003F66D4D9
MNPFKPFNNEIVEIKHFIRNGFQTIKFYALRIDYDLVDYEHQNICWTFSKIKRSVFLLINGCISLLYLSLCVLWPHNDYLISMEIYDEIVNSKRNDFIVIEMIIVFILRECLYYYHLLQFIKYKSKINEFIIKYWHYNDNELSSEYRYYLIQFYQKSCFISTNSYRIFTIGLLAIDFMFNFFSFYLYDNGQISLMKFLLTSIFFFSYVCQCIFIIGDSLILLSFIVKIQKSIWYRFHYQYVYLYSETYKFNSAVRFILLITELMSKSTVVICLLFYSHQTKMYLQNTLVTLIFITIFCLISGLNFRIAQLPSYNRLCWLSLHRWIARSQWLNLERKQSHNRLPLRYSLKSRLFLQSMTNNQFGFTCGRLFFISKFKYIQMFIMNFHMAIKFYKKICLSQT